jgi:hypothetical protein
MSREDAENLADGSVASYLKEMKPTLFIESVRLEIAEDRWIKTGIDNEHWNSTSIYANTRSPFGEASFRCRLRR